jgi:hypothetical protein
MLIGSLKVVIYAQVPLCEVKDRDTKEVGEFEQVADFGLCTAILIRSNVAPVEPDTPAELILAKLHLLAQKADIAVQKNRILCFLNQAHDWMAFPAKRPNDEVYRFALFILKYK